MSSLEIYPGLPEPPLIGSLDRARFCLSDQAKQDNPPTPSAIGAIHGSIASQAISEGIPRHNTRLGRLVGFIGQIVRAGGRK